MSIFLDVSGESTFGIGICARCSRKFRLAELRPDPNYPALMVCSQDTDDYDPYRLSPRPEDKINLPFVRPDTNIATDPLGIIAEDGNEFALSENDERFIIPG